MSFNDRQSVIEPGDGLVVRWPGAVLVLTGGDQAAAATLVAELGADFDDPPGAARLIEGLRDHAPGTAVDGLSAAIDTTSGVRALAMGSGVVIVGDQHLRSSGPLAEVELALSDQHILVGDAEVASFARDATDLRLGIVPGTAAKLVGTAVAPLPPPPVPEELAPAPPPSRPFESIDLRSPVIDEDREPLSVLTGPEPQPDHEHADEVSGINCSRGHFNNPLAAYCLVCGISMVHLTHNLVRGPRPTLGFVVFDDGNTFALDRSYVIGRDPAHSTTDGRSPLVADDPSHSVSRAHAALDLIEWDVVLSDAGSTNGTFLWNAAENRWDHLHPGSTVTLRPGALVALGRRTFVYESVHRV